MRAAVYARFSTDQQRDASIEDQVRGCERLALANGLTIVSRFEDHGISGGTHQRPGYQSLLQAARAGSFDVILAEDVSRLWRNRAEFGARSCELEDLDVNLLTCVGDDTRRDGWGLLISIKSALAEHARREISYRTRRGLEGKALAGESTGGRTYGYAGHDAVDPAEAATVRRMFELYAGGLTAVRVAAHLNGEGSRAPRGGLWRPSTVCAILSNARYTGAVRWGGSVSKHSAADSRRTRRLMRPEAAVTRQADELAIIPPELWQRVTAARAERTCVPSRALA